MKIQITIKNNQISQQVREEMWSIYANYYHYTKEAFMSRIANNNLYAFYYEGKKLIGFTGLRIDELKFSNKKQLLIYFGQTIILRAYRGKSLLPITAAKLCLKYFRQMLSSDVYFWFDALTYKAYLVAAKTVPECYPSRKHSTPNNIQNLIDYVGKKHYGDAYNPVNGTVRKSTQLVNDVVVLAGLHDPTDKDIQFYLKANPNASKGHGLLTFVPGSWTTISTLLKRYLGKTLGLKKGKWNTGWEMSFLANWLRRVL